MAQRFEPSNQQQINSSENLQKGQTRNIRTPVSTTALPSKATLGLFEAAANKNLEIVDIYLSQGGDINCKNCNNMGETPFLRHIKDGATDIRFTQALIERGADINIPDANGVTPLMWAVYPNNFYYNTPALTKVTLLLLKNNVKIESVDSEGRTAINHIIDTQLPSPRLYMLLNANADINHQTTSTGSTLLMKAAQNCAKSDFLEYLLKANANVSLKNFEGKTALDIALEQATKSGANSTCNNAVKFLSNPSGYTSTTENTSLRSDTSLTGTLQGVTDMLRKLNGRQN